MVVTRLAWGARKRLRHPGTLNRDAVVGVALHWPGMGRTPARNPEHVKQLLRGWQRMHQDDKGWSDIAYQVAVDQWGNCYSLRGKRHMSAANGTRALNLTYGAVLLVLADGEEPSAAMVKATNRLIKRYRKLFPNATRIVGHGDIRPGGTACPGPWVSRAIRAGVIK